MSETVQTPTRARPARIEAQGETRRRRRPGSLNRMVQMSLDIFEPEQLDLENYVYRWVNDEKARIRQLTVNDDYDFVTTGELLDFDPNQTDSESTERVRMIVGTDRAGNVTYAYLCKKRRAFWEQDNEAVVQNREDMMAGRVYRGDATDEKEQEREDDRYYVPPGNTVGSASARRRGPVAKNF